MTTPSEIQRALRSENGKDWQQSGPVRNATWPVEPGEREHIVKLVLGRLGEAMDENDWSDVLPILASGLKDHFPNLTHLHFWGLPMEQLGPLPDKLKVLDVRKCSRLTLLPVLPNALETLDLGECVALKDKGLPKQGISGLRWFHVDGCLDISSKRISSFLEDCRDLEEFSAKGCSQIDELTLPEQDANPPDGEGHPQFPPRRLKKLVLEGCLSLRKLPCLAGYPWLYHLNLSGCKALENLPKLPAGMRYVILHGCDVLTGFLGQKLGPLDRGAKDENVIANLRSRQKFGDEIGFSAHAKILLMGDGRVGKTTLAKRLVWDSMGSDWQAANHSARPVVGEPFTEKVAFRSWQTRVFLEPEQANELNATAERARLDPPCDEFGTMPATVRMLDFGGQELYHMTHRIFASEGTVFLLVWNENDPDWKEIDKEGETVGFSPEEWRDFNRRRTLEYWLDYIFSMREDAKVALVCTGCKSTAARAPWKPRLGRHTAREGIECFHLDSVDDIDCAANQEYQDLRKWLAEKCAGEAWRTGIVQPRFFGEIGDYVGSLLEENERERARHRDPRHLLISAKDWGKRVQEAHAKTSSSLGLDSNDIEAITRYLHDGGRIFRVRGNGEEAILIDQYWGSRILYSLLSPRSPLTRVIKENGGWFQLAALEVTKTWQRLPDGLQREMILRYMEECRVIARIAGDGEVRLGGALYVATEKWLLPEFAAVEARISAVAEYVRRPGTRTLMREDFRFEEPKISEFDYRALSGYLSTRFGKNVIWFRNGMFATNDELNPDWFIQLKWEEEEKDGFSGRLNARICADSDVIEAYAGLLEEALAGDACPVPVLRRLKRARDCHDELDISFYRKLEGGDFQVAVSSAGADASLAEALVGFLKAKGLRTAWYRDDQCRSGDRAELMNFMKSLSLPPVIVLILSDHYLSEDNSKFYCAWELADAVKAMASGKRVPAQTVVIYSPGEIVNSRTIHRVAKTRFLALEDHFWRQYVAEGSDGQVEFKPLQDMSLHFKTAVSNLAVFQARRGNLGTYAHALSLPGGGWDFSEVLDHVKKGLETTHSNRKGPGC
ncbi:GTPase SAR1 family protein [Haloferula luteola]|uniref:GTPase SAR1 family protein n=1 Tax=Haloferula luteola TaxID=595692 RepID=A0A840V3B0_9BACT|nr:hypothetical protein [Haloferula luteola]MBB5351526.1 GTPase SAR1 family protein [Haloferula luteola]